MIENDNSVNIENEKGRYHHGDLRAALISEGLRLLAIGDVEQLSLRQIARNVGVSPTAVYRHFPDKQALLTALAMEGGAQLRRNIAALAAPGTSEEAQRVGFVRSWAMVHGLAMLMLDGQVPADESLIDRVVDTAFVAGPA